MTDAGGAGKILNAIASAGGPADRHLSIVNERTSCSAIGRSTGGCDSACEAVHWPVGIR
jgi:hypothetical protein